MDSIDFFIWIVCCIIISTGFYFKVYRYYKHRENAKTKLLITLITYCIFLGLGIVVESEDTRKIVLTVGIIVLAVVSMICFPFFHSDDVDLRTI